MLAIIIILLLCGFHAGSPISGVGDFMITTSILMFAAGDGPGTSLTFSIPIVDDDLVEGQEDIDILATIIGGSGIFVGGGITATGDINILDDDRMSYLTCLMSTNRRAKPVLVALIAMMILDQNTTHTLA